MGKVGLSGAETPSGVPLVPSPPKVALCATDDSPLPPPVDASVSVLPAGVIVMFDPAASVTLSERLLRLLTTCPAGIVAPVTHPLHAADNVSALVAVKLRSA